MEVSWSLWRFPPPRHSISGKMSLDAVGEDGRGRSCLSRQRTESIDDILDMDLLSGTAPARNMPATIENKILSFRNIH